jgi:hypothetical protein
MMHIEREEGEREREETFAQYKKEVFTLYTVII